MRVLERCLYSRNEYYYFRIALPRFMHPALGVKEIRIALRTQDLSEARLKAVTLDFDLKQRLKAFTRALKDSPEGAIETLVEELQELKNQHRPQSITGYHKREELCFSHIVKRYMDDCPADAHSTRVHKISTYEQFQEVMGDLVFKAIKIEEASRRKVPVHQALLEQGLMEYVSQIAKEGHTRLFPDIPMGASTRNYSSVFTRRFMRILMALNIKRQGLCFHSLRHTFIDGLRNAGVERHIVMTLTGHQSSKDVHDGYGYGYNLSVLRDGINKLEFVVL